MSYTRIETAFAHGYNPTQFCHPNAQNPLIWDEVQAYYQSHPLYSAIIRLAKARIVQALLDIGGMNESIKNLAFGWIFSDQSDFRAWCSDAGFNPAIVRHKAKDIIENGLNWRADAGKGARYEERSASRRVAA